MTHLPDRTNDKLRAALTHDDALDDVKRARIWANLDARLDAPVSARRWRWPVAFAIAASAAAVLGIVMRHGSDGDVRTLVAPAEATLDAPLGPHTHARLVGPAELDVLGTAGDVTTVRLSTGTLYAQFDGGAGRSLRIVTAAATIEIVGTVFAVEVRDDDTCVSVSHGRVRATSSRGEWFVSTGEHRCGRDAAVSPIDPRVKDALSRHEAVIAAATRTPDAVATPNDVTASISSPSSNGAAPPPTNKATSSNGATTSLTPPPTSNDATSPASSHTTTPSAPPSSNAATASSTSATTSIAPPSSNHATSPTPPPSSNTATSNMPAANGAAMPPHATAANTGASASTSGRVDSASSRSNASTSGASAPSSRAGGSTIAPPTPIEPPPPPAPPARPTAADLYRTAEAALARHDLAGADRVLATLVTDMPTSPLVDQALYERARIAFSRRAWGDARRHLDALAALGASSLTEPGRYLACRVAVSAHDSSARRCLTDYRASFPKSPHDADARAMLARLPQDPP